MKTRRFIMLPDRTVDPVIRSVKDKANINQCQQDTQLCATLGKILMGLALLTSPVSHALTPTQQAVANYFTNPNLCTNAGGPPPPIVGDPELAAINTPGPANVFLPALVGSGGYDCSSLGPGVFQTGIETLLNAPAPFDTETALQGLAFEEVITMGTLNIEVNGAQMANLIAHVEGLHQGSIHMRYPSIPANLLPADQARGAGAAAGNDANGIGFFVNTRVDTGDKDASSIETGFDFDAYGITGGMDVRLSDMFVIGVAAGYGATEADYTTSSGNMDMDGYSLSLFGTLYKKDKYYIDGIVNLTRNSFDSRRTFTDPNGAVQTANAETDGDILTVGLGVGYEHHDKDVTSGLFARLNYTAVDIDGFTETGAGPWGLQVDDQELTSFEGVVGFQASKIFSRPWGILVPQFRLELVHEFENESRIVNARFLGALQNGITTTLLQPTDEPDRNYFNLSLATSAQFSHGRSAFIQYTGLLDQEAVSEHAVELGVRWHY
jgi:outer membrane autotransporter protein